VEPFLSINTELILLLYLHNVTHNPFLQANVY